MAWLNRYNRVWRVIELVLLLVAIMGPWVFDLISVPAQYACTTAVRLEGDFCGIPMPGIWIISFAILVPVNVIVELATGTAALADRIREFGFSLVLLLLVLPFISSLIMILGKHNRRWQVFHIVALGLSLCFSLFMGTNLIATARLSNAWWNLWGIWLYLGVTISALVFELLTFNSERKTRIGISNLG